MRTLLSILILLFLSTTGFVAFAAQNQCIDLFSNNSYEKYVKINNKAMYYRVDAPVGTSLRDLSNETIYVGIHGLTDNSNSLQTVTDQLVSQGKTVFRPDLIGHGRSLIKQNSIVRVNMEDQAKSIARILQGLGAKEVVLFGHSYGGGVSIILVDVLKKMGITVDHLTLIEPYVMSLDQWYGEHIEDSKQGTLIKNARSNGKTWTAYGKWLSAMTGGLSYFTGQSQFFNSNAAIRTNTAYMMDSISKFTYYYYVLPAFSGRITNLFTMSIVNNPESHLPGLDPVTQARGAVGVMTDENLFSRIKNINVPVDILVGGEGSPLGPHDLLKEAAHAVPNGMGKLIEVPTDKPHYPMEKDPAGIAKLILKNKP